MSKARWTGGPWDDSQREPREQDWIPLHDGDDAPEAVRRALAGGVAVDFCCIGGISRYRVSPHREQELEIRPETVASVDRLIKEFWGSVHIRRCRAALRVDTELAWHVYSLRKGL